MTKPIVYMGTKWRNSVPPTALRRHSLPQISRSPRFEECRYLSEPLGTLG